MPWTSATTRATGFLVTAAIWNAEHVANLDYLELVAEQTYTAPVSVTGTGDVDIVSLGAVTYEAVPHMLEFYSPKMTIGGSAACSVKLKDGGTSQGNIVQANASADTVVCVAVPITPSAGSHTYKIACANGSGQTTTVNAGAGGAGNFYPGYIRIRRVPA